jgi:hypothetical protein
MTEQLDLFAARRIRAPGRHIARRMIAALSTHDGPMLRRDFVQRGLTERECRAGCVAAHGRILFGQSGYRLLATAAPEHVRECLATIQSQIEALQEKHRQIARRAHKLLQEDAR